MLRCWLHGVRAGELDGIPGIAEVQEIDALHHSTIGDVETGDDPGLEHGVPLRFPYSGTEAGERVSPCS